MRLISDEILVDSYFKAIELRLEEEFVELLFEEIKRRKLDLKFYKHGEAQVS